MQQGGRLQSQLSNLYLRFGLVSPHPIQQGTPFCALLYTTQDSTPRCFQFWKMYVLEMVSLSAQAGQQGAGCHSTQTTKWAAGNGSPHAAGCNRTGVRDSSCLWNSSFPLRNQLPNYCVGTWSNDKAVLACSTSWALQGPTNTPTISSKKRHVRSLKEPPWHRHSRQH